jgi:hypothetical protein
MSVEKPESIVGGIASIVVKRLGSVRDERTCLIGGAAPLRKPSAEQDPRSPKDG